MTVFCVLHPSVLYLYEFLYWEVSKSGGAFTKWNSSSDYGVLEDWVIRPVYTQYHTITFDFGDGTQAGMNSKSLLLEDKTYSLAEIAAAITPVKTADDTYTYTFDGWNHADSLTLDSDITLTAQYTAVEKIYTVKFITETGTINGEETTTFTGNYSKITADIQDFLSSYNTDTISDVLTEDTVYSFHSWERLQDGLNITYTAVWDSTPRYYQVSIDAGAGSFTQTTSFSFTKLNNDSISLGDYVPTKESDNEYNYTFTGWQDENNNTYAPDAVLTVTGDITLTAVYARSDRIYTVTFYSGMGAFSDGSDKITCTGKYGEPLTTDFDDPVYEYTSASGYYTFTGWNNTIPTTFTADLSLTAQYTWVYYEFTVTFDAGSGAFTNGSTLELTGLHYGDMPTPTELPTKAGTDALTYTFAGWSRDVTEVTHDTTYTATYTAQRTNNPLADTGITVTKDGITEDIAANSIAGYSYDVEDYYGNEMPTLRITGDGLTFSGTSDSVYIIIEPTATNVTFDSLSISGSLPLGDGILTISESAAELTLTISGAVNFINTKEGCGVIRCERPVSINGTGTENNTDTLNISCVNSGAVYMENNASFSGLTLNFTITDGSAEGYPTALSYDGDSTHLWDFTDYDITITSAGNGIASAPSISLDSSSLTINCNGYIVEYMSDLTVTDSALDCTGVYGLNASLLEISGTSEVSIQVSDENTYALSVMELNFADFVGTFLAENAGTTPVLPAICAYSGISFLRNNMESRTGYDVNGLEILSLTDEYDTSYYTFGTNTTGAVSVTITGTVSD